MYVVPSGGIDTRAVQYNDTRNTYVVYFASKTKV